MALIKDFLPLPWEIITTNTLNTLYNEIDDIEINRVNLADEAISYNHFVPKAINTHAINFRTGAGVVMTATAPTIGVWQTFPLSGLPAYTLQAGEVFRFSISVPVLRCSVPPLSTPSVIEAAESVIYFRVRATQNTGGADFQTVVAEPQGYSLVTTSADTRLPAMGSSDYRHSLYYETIIISGFIIPRVATEIKSLTLEYLFDRAGATVNSSPIYGFYLVCRR